MLWHILVQIDRPGPSRSSLLFMWIDTHALTNAAFNISPFFAGSVHASPNTHDAFLFSLTEIVYQTHCISSFFCCFVVTAHLDAPRPISVMPILEGWKLLPRVSHFMSLRSQQHSLARWTVLISNIHHIVVAQGENRQAEAKTFLLRFFEPLREKTALRSCRARASAFS